MTLTTHTVIGAAIGTAVGDPVLGFVLGMVSHFLVDMIPHGDNELADRFRLHKKKKLAVAYVTVDAIVAMTVLLLVIPEHAHSVSHTAFVWTVFGSVLPDFLVGLSDIYKKNRYLRSFTKFHFLLHDFFSRRYGDVKLRYALIGQLVAIVILLKTM